MNSTPASSKIQLAWSLVTRRDNDALFHELIRREIKHELQTASDTAMKWGMLQNPSVLVNAVYLALFGARQLIPTDKRYFYTAAAQEVAAQRVGFEADTIRGATDSTARDAGVEPEVQAFDRCFLELCGEDRNFGRLTGWRRYTGRLLSEVAALSGMEEADVQSELRMEEAAVNSMVEGKSGA